MSNNKFAPLIRDSISTKEKILKNDLFLQQIENIGQTIISSFELGGKLLIAGNGGSAADAQHFAAELAGKFEKVRRGLPAIALTTDSSFITAWSNDDTFTDIFARQIQALGLPGDTFLGISTSGESRNILKAFKAASKAKLNTVALLGSGGGKAKTLADNALIVPSNKTPRIQESHIMIIHLLCYQIEAALG